MTTLFTQKALLNKIRNGKNSKKNLLQKGFTLVELMVVVAIVGVLSAVALPKLTEAQNVAKSSAAKQEVVNAAKTCTIALIAGDGSDGDVAATTTGDVTNAATTCADDVDFAYTGGGDTWTVTMSGGVAGTPVKS